MSATPRRVREQTSVDSHQPSTLCSPFCSLLLLFTVIYQYLLFVYNILKNLSFYCKWGKWRLHAIYAVNIHTWLVLFIYFMPHFPRIQFIYAVFTIHIVIHDKFAANGCVILMELFNVLIDFFFCILFSRLKPF
jgi:hypothetical protein